jgi:hypothetical protein
MRERGTTANDSAGSESSGSGQGGPLAPVQPVALWERAACSRVLAAGVRW